MEIGIVGLARKGGDIARRLARAGVRVTGFDADENAVAALVQERVLNAAPTAMAVVHALPAPRVVWLMVPAGSITELTIEELWPEMAPGDVIVDGGSAHYKDSQRRAAALAAAGIHFVDCGIAGGDNALDDGYATMFGGDTQGAHALLPFAKILAPVPDRGFLHCGPPGAGHFVKMVHDGIESGMRQAAAEGFALLDGKRDFHLDVAAIAQMWRDVDAALSRAQDAVLRAPGPAGSGDMRWVVNEAVEQGVHAPVLAMALMARLGGPGRRGAA